MILYLPVGLQELVLIYEGGMKAPACACPTNQFLPDQKLAGLCSVLHKRLAGISRLERESHLPDPAGVLPPHKHSPEEVPVRGQQYFPADAPDRVYPQ